MEGGGKRTRGNGKKKQKEMSVEGLIYFAFPHFKISHAYLKFLNIKKKKEKSLIINYTFL